MQICLIRPGSTDFNEQRRIQGTLEMPLTPQGADEVARLIADVRDLGIEAVYCSDCEPARQTAEVLAEALHVKCKRLDEMQNLDHGLWQGMLVDEVRRKQPRVYRQWQDEPECVCPPGGEMLGGARERVDKCLKKLIKKHKQGMIGLIVPEPLATVVRSQLRHCDVGDLWKACCEHGRWEMIAVETAKPVAP